MRTARSSPDLVVTLLLAVLAAVAALSSVGTAIQVVLAVPLVFGLPGYALTAALLRPGTADPFERLAYSVALSLAATALTGLVAHLFAGLDRTVWATALALVTCSATLIAMRIRRLDLETPAPVTLPSISSALCIGAAVAVAAGAVAIASTGAENTRVESRFTELWVLPRGGTATSLGVRAVSIGVQSHEGASSSFGLRVTQGSHQLLSRSISLRDGEKWTDSIELRRADAGRVSVTLVRDGEIYRRVHLSPTHAGAGP